MDLIRRISTCDGYIDLSYYADHDLKYIEICLQQWHCMPVDDKQEEQNRMGGGISIITNKHEFKRDLQNLFCAMACISSEIDCRIKHHAKEKKEKEPKPKSTPKSKKKTATKSKKKTKAKDKK
jgi:hypothetical protein